MNCKNCNTVVDLNYCPKCGQPVHLKRIDRHYIAHEIEHLLHFEKGFLYTIRVLLTKPGESIKQFLTENRSRLIKPLVFLIFTSLVYSLFNNFFHIEDKYTKPVEFNKSAIFTVVKWIQNNYGYSNLIMGVLIALWSKILFRSKGYNLYEILVLLCYVMGLGMVLMTLFAFFEVTLNLNLMLIGSVFFILYTTWAIGQFFGKKSKDYLKAFFVYLLGMITFWILAVLIGLSIDLITKS